MNIIVCGAGRVGAGIAARLASEGNTVTVIDLDPHLVRKISNELDVRGVVGNGAFPDVLKRAGVDAADMIIAVTHSDEVNMIACQVAHSLFNVPTKVARVRAQDYLQKEWADLYSRENMPIDIIISPEIEIGRAILRRLNTPGAFDVVPFFGGRVKLLGIRITEGCPIINVPIKQIPEIFTDLHAVIVGVRRGTEVFTPSPDDPLDVNDEAYFIVRTEHASRLLEIIGASAEKARHVVIIGAGNIGKYLASELEGISSVRTRMIEMDHDRAEKAARDLSRTVILHGDAMSADIQREAGVDKTEVVLCLTNDDKTNILSGALAKKIGAKQAISLVNEVSMQTLQSELGIDMIIDPRATTVSSVLRHVRRGRIIDVFTLTDGQAEIIEGEVLETSHMVGKTIAEINGIEGIKIGAIIRGETVHYPEETFVFKADDRVVLLTELRSVKNVEQMFRVSMDYF